MFDIFFLPLSLKAACTGSSPNWTSTPDFSSVTTCANSALSGDTIHVSSGSATWNGTLTISAKTLYIIGSGINSTTITGNGLLIDFNPSAVGIGMRISGFNFNLNGGQGIQLSNNSHIPVHSNIRMDNNRFYNSSAPGAAIENHSARGVIDSNIFDNLQYPLRIGWGTSPGTWDWSNNPELTWGLPNDNIYVEDNTFLGVSISTSDQDEGGRYVFRYNNFGGVSNYPWLDIHGGRGDLQGGMGGEVYGNIYQADGFLMSHRGGRLTFHHNSAPSGSELNIYNNDGCPPLAKENINNSYHFLNRNNLNGPLIGWTSSGGDLCNSVIINSTFWMDATSCIDPSVCSSITEGVGCGPLANRPANCTTGTGYWATNQSCTDLTGHVGPNPTSPISGTLYKCVSTNTWTSYYTPLVYPHPLRTSAITAALLAPQNLRVVSL
ncbi:MAG: hypothetical protein ACXVB4_16145 [Pseudobdellovibrionaceae bacterium]